MFCPGGRWCNRDQWPPSQWPPTIFDHAKCRRKGRERDRSDGSTARAAVGLRATRTGGQVRALGFVPPRVKSRISSGCNFSTSWSPQPSRRANEAITPSASSPPDMTKDTEAAAGEQQGLYCTSATRGPSEPADLWTPTSPGCNTDYRHPRLVISHPPPTCLDRAVEGREVQGAVPGTVSQCGS